MVIERGRRLKREKKKEKEKEFIDAKGDVAMISAMPRVARHSRRRPPWPLLYLSPENKSSRSAFCLQNSWNSTGSWIRISYLRFLLALANLFVDILFLQLGSRCSGVPLNGGGRSCFPRSGHSLGSCDRIFQRRQSLLQGHQLFCACSCLGLGSWRNFLRSVCRNDKGFSTDWYFVSRIVSSSILVRSSSREMALRCCYSGYIAFICLYINVSMSFSFFI